MNSSHEHTSVDFTENLNYVVKAQTKFITQKTQIDTNEMLLNCLHAKNYKNSSVQ